MEKKNRRVTATPKSWENDSHPLTNIGGSEECV
jgi:hypothetical protein